MSTCPDVAVLEARGWTPEVSAHVAACGSCKLVMELIEERSQAAASRDRRVECAKFEALLAVRMAGGIGTTAAGLLDEHLEDCDECRAIAETMAPANDRTGDQTALATIERSAYALGAEVARGGMGRIVSARDLRIGRPVAVKELLSNTSTQAARFEREARVTARLQHPGIVPIYEIGRWANGTPFYTMRMVAGRTLRAELADRKTLATRLALLPAVITASEAVAFAHANRVIHRDLTPSNIMVGEYGETVVIDWGLAKDLADETATDEAGDGGPYRVDPRVADDLTVDGAVIGTASYMPPEQAAGDRVDARADVYALGAILYHVLIGQAPYRGRNDAVLAAVKAGPPPALTTAEAPRDLVSIVEKAMARDPADRYPSARELAGELAGFQAGRLVEAHRYSRGELLRRWVRRHRAVVLAASATLVALLVIGTIALAGIVSARDRAERGERDAIEQRSAAVHANTELLEEQGRQALLAGNPLQASVWLSTAYSAGNQRPSLRFLLGSAMRDLETFERKLDCGSSINSIEISPDEARVLVACDNAVRVWGLVDGASVSTFAPPNAHFSGAKYSHDGRMILAWGPDQLARVWDAASGTLRFTLAGHSAKVSNAAYSPADRLIVTSSFDRTLRVWDAVTGTLVRSIEAAMPPQVGVRGGFIGDDRLVSATTDGVMKVWDVATGRLLRTIANGTQIVGGDLEIGAASHLVVVCGADSVAKIWNLDTGVLEHAFAGHTDMVWTCALSPDRRRLITTSNDGTAKIWDVESGRIVQTFTHGGVVTGGRLSPDGQTLITGGFGGLRVWDVTTGALLGADDTASPQSGRLAVGGNRIVAGDDETLVIWRGLGATRAHAFHAPAGATIALTSADGRRAAIDSHGAITIWDIDTGRPLVHEALRAPVIMSAAGLAARSATGIAIIDPESGKTRATLPIVGQPTALGEDGRYLAVTDDAHRPAVWDIARAVEVAHWDPGWTLDGLETGGDRVVAWPVVSLDANAEVWALDPPHLVHLLPVGNGVLREAHFAHDPGHVVLVTGDALHEVTLWDIPSAHRIRTVTGVVSAQFDPTRQFGALSLYGHVQVERLADGVRVADFPGGFLVNGIDVARDGTFVAGGMMLDAKGALWDGTGQLLAALPYPRVSELSADSFGLKPHAVTFSRDGSRLLSQGAGEIVVLDLRPELRSASDVEKSVERRAPWKIDHGRLVPVAPGLATLRGRVTRNGTGVASATVNVTRNGSPGDTTDSTGDGAYELRDVRAGPVQVDAVSLAAGAFTRPRPIQLLEGENLVDIELELAGSISGVVRDDRGHPSPGLHLHAQCREGNDGGDATTATDGTFTIRALSGGCSYGLTLPNDNRLLEPTAPVLVKDGANHVTGVQLILRHVAESP